MAIENRSYPRIEVHWPVTLVTENGLVTGTIRNLSLAGVLIQCPPVPDLLYSFRLVLKPSERQQILTTAKRIWSKTHRRNGAVLHTMGVGFTYIPEHDRDVMIEEISNLLWKRNISRCLAR
jgi:hypothetical protein